MLPLQREALIGFTLLIYGFVGVATAAPDSIISEHVGKTVVLPCPVSIDKCGELHSINWFKGSHRIAALLLDDSNETSVTDEYQKRLTVEQNPFRIIIKDLKISDEDTYLCDTTFFIPVETCDNYNGYRIELNVLVPPTKVEILDEKGDHIENGTVMGPMQERQTLKASCVVRNTRPQPDVGWWRRNKRLTTHSASYDEKDGLFTATLELELVLSRDDLGSDIECRVTSAAIEGTIVNNFRVELQVRPTSITLNGVEHHTVQGSKVVLTCDVHGASPAVNITWFNSTETISPVENDLTKIITTEFNKNDGTFHTKSELIFNATRFENDRNFRCDADNIVLQINREKPFTAVMTLEVLYPPVVRVAPLETVVNSSDTVLLNCEYVANPASLTKVAWYRNSDVVNVNDTERYEGGNSENVALVIRSTSKDDIGNYTCQLENAIGKGISEQQIDLDVQFVPIVKVLMSPDDEPVKESEGKNVTLYCSILEANPPSLTKVRWYANATLLKELPDCDDKREDLCNIDPSKLLLESIGRGFFYNYSCEGYNAAGWGPRSDEKELKVHYEPGPATLTHFPKIAVKGKSVTFSCSVDDPGYPESNRFRWLRGGRGPLQDVVTKDWTVEPVGLDSRTNYSCYASNDGGDGIAATVNLEVHAPPKFINNLLPYTGILHTLSSANLTCRIECVPRCEISWLKDGVPIEQNDTRYFVKEKYTDASPGVGDFESMLSVLHFNMSNWPNKKFDIEADNAKYVCLSTGNTVGASVNSTTYFSIEYAPDSTTVSAETVYVHEDTIPGRVICKSKANPEPTYEWNFKNKTITRGNALIINSPMAREDTGRYQCVAYNKHGRSTAETFLDVQYKPRCEIERRQDNDQDTLICTAFGNPEEADFSWSIKGENETVELLGSGDSRTHKNKSYFVLTEDYAIARTYRCVANNTVGVGTFCEIEVAEQLAWWQVMNKRTLIILIAGILLLLLAVIIICCIIICICRRRRRQDKYHTEVSISATHSVLSYQPTTSLPTLAPNANRTTEPSMATAATISDLTAGNTVTEIATATNSAVAPPEVPKSPPRWPLRPGVMVHVRSDTKQNLAANRMTFSQRTPAQKRSNNDQQSPDNTLTSFTSSNATHSTAQTTLMQSPILTPTATNGNSQTLAQFASPPHPPPYVVTPTYTATLGRIPRNTKHNTSIASGVGSVTGFQSLPRNTSICARVELKNVLLTDAELPTTQQDQEQQELADEEVVDELQQRVMTTTPAPTPPITPPTLPKRNPRPTRLVIGGASPATHVNSAADLSAHSGCELLPRTLRPKIVAATATVQTEDIVDVAPAETVAEEEIAASTLQETTQTKCQSNAGSLHRVQRAFVKFFTRRTHQQQVDGAVDGTRDSQRSHIGLLGAVARSFWRSKAAQNEFGVEHRLKGIRCSGSVTYKKTSVQEQRTANAAATASSQNSATSSNNNHNSNNRNSVITATAATTTTTTTAATPPISPKSHASVTFQTFSETPPKKRNGSGRVLALRNTPPPRPPAPLQRKINVEVAAAAGIVPNIERVQIHEKSSSLADPLTEPGEYENLPFHGLQTAPNKFSTTPTNFNNNTNVVRVAPRPKRLNGNISQTYVQQQQKQQQQQQQQQYHHQQPQTQQQQYNTIQFGHAPTSMNSLNRSLHNIQDPTIPTPPTHTNPHQITYNLNNCFPKSYTEYYHQQNQQQQRQQQQQQKFTTNSSSNAQLLNAIEHDYPAPVIERYAAVDQAVNANPFLAASNFKKFDTATGVPYSNGGPPGAVITATGSMHRNKRNKQIGLDKSEDKKFYSLKFNCGGSGGGGGGKHKPIQAALKQNTTVHAGAAPLGSSATSGGTNKCKRHHSFAGGSLGDIDSGVAQYQQQQQQQQQNVVGLGVPLYATSNKAATANAMRFYDPPVYENLNDSVQIHECQIETHGTPPATTTTATVLLHAQPPPMHRTSTGGGVHKKKHHQRQHQPKDGDYNVIEPERMSIYRSDSGISNSSYECVTPVANSRGGATPPPSKATKSLGKSNSLAHSTIAANFNSSKTKSPRIIPATPVYMNVDGSSGGGAGGAQPERCHSPASSSMLVNSSYESASSSTTTTGVGSADPISLSSNNSLYSGSGGGGGGGVGNIKSAVGVRCTRHQQPAAEITTPEEFEQYQLGHAHAHSSSSLSVASSVSASGGAGAGVGGGGKKCKKRQTPAIPTAASSMAGGYLSGSEQAKFHTNPFLAAATAAANITSNDNNNNSRTACRQTNAYAIKGSNNNQINIANSNNNETNNNCAKSTTTCQTKSQQYQQLQQQQQQQQKQYLQQIQWKPYSVNSSSSSGNNNNNHNANSYQQPMLMPRELLLQPYNLKATTTRPIACNNNYNNNNNSINNLHQRTQQQQQQQQRQQQQRQRHKSNSAQNLNELTATVNYIATATADYDNDNYQQQNQRQHASGAYSVRPMRLPLRKHHSFHFQPSQTVAGIKPCHLQQLREQLQQQRQQHLEQFAAISPPAAAQRGPLIFQPFTLNEQQAFKPIEPPPTDVAFDDDDDEDDDDANRDSDNDDAATPTPLATEKIAYDINRQPSWPLTETEVSDMNAQQRLRRRTPTGGIDDSGDNNSTDVAPDNEALKAPAFKLKKRANIGSNLMLLHPAAASLEALEALSQQANSELIFTLGDTGSSEELQKQQMLARLHQNLHGGVEGEEDIGEMATEAEAAADDDNKNFVDVADDDEDLGYSYCEDEIEDDADDLGQQQDSSLNVSDDYSPNATVILTTDGNGGQVKYVTTTKTYREVHI